MEAVTDGDDQLTDIIAGTSSSDLQSLLLEPDLHGDKVRDELDDGIFEVYGPPTKRPRTSIPDSPSSRSSDQPAYLSQRRRHVDPASSPACDIPLSNVSNETPCVGVNPSPEPAAIATAEDPTDDGPLGAHFDDPDSATDLPQVT